MEENQIERYNVLLKKLVLTNFRCFSDLEIEFETKNQPEEKKYPLTVIIAENGGGKTAVLEAIVGCLKNLLSELYINYQISQIPKKDIKIGGENSKAQLITNIEYGYLEEVEIEVEIENENVEVLSKKEYTTISAFEDANLIFTSGADYEYPLQELAIPLKELSADVKLPILVYFGGETVSVNYNPKLSVNPNKLQVVYGNALEGQRFQFTNFYNWWKRNEDRMLRMKEETKEYKAISYQFQKIRTAVEYLMNDDDTKPIYKNLRINEDLNMGMDKMTYDENGQTVGKGDFIEISQFSAGEKSLFAYVADLGLRLLHANPLDSSAESEGLYVIKGRGVALIDEIGLHLHLRWQQKVIEKLLKIFPDIQFIMTTHSLIALGKLKSQDVRLISDNTIYSIPNTYGQDIAVIIEKIWQLSSSIIKSEIREIYRLLTNNNLEKLEEAKNKLTKLQTQVGNEIPAIKEAWVILNHKEKHLRR